MTRKNKSGRRATYQPKPDRKRELFEICLARAARFLLPVDVDAIVTYVEIAEYDIAWDTLCSRLAENHGPLPAELEDGITQLAEECSVEFTRWNVGEPGVAMAPGDYFPAAETSDYLRAAFELAEPFVSEDRMALIRSLARENEQQLAMESLSTTLDERADEIPAALVYLVAFIGPEVGLAPREWQDLGRRVRRIEEDAGEPDELAESVLRSLTLHGWTVQRGSKARVDLAGWSRHYAAFANSFQRLENFSGTIHFLPAAHLDTAYEELVVLDSTSKGPLVLSHDGMVADRTGSFSQQIEYFLLVLAGHRPPLDNHPFWTMFR